MTAFELTFTISRMRSRLALAAGAVALSLSAPAGAQPRFSAPGAPTTLTPEQQAARAIYKEMVEINTVDSVGSVTKAAEAIAKRFRDAGFPESDIAIVGPADKPAKQNLVVRYHGKNASLKPILLLAHLDVVAALRSDWPRDPFTMVEQDGYFLGRGVADDKSMAAILTANVLRYKKEGWVPDRDLILALTADEEGGGSNGVGWIIANRKELIDAEYAINEGGGGTLQDDKPLFHSIQAAEKVPVNYTLTVTNTGGHSSVPRKDNAIYTLAAALTRIEKYTFPVELNDVSRPFFEQTAKVEMPSLSAAMRAIAKNPKDTAAARIISTDPRYASMLRTSCVATRLSGGHADNALPQTATANVNCRVAPTSTGAQVLEVLQKLAGDSVKMSMRGGDRNNAGGPPAPIHPTLLNATTQLTNKMFNGVPVIPTMSTGATDGRFLRAAGIPTYGVSGVFSSPGETNAHGRDEKLRIKSFYDGLDFLYQLVKMISSAKPIS